ncbi:MAG: CHASE2 domain-containing protein [Lyngbya sp.]|nr:CHASE2 domain-containing protein [Lyngbya sp.]
MLQLSVQHIEQSCLFELTWEQVKRLSSQVPFPQTLIVFYQEWRQAYINYYQSQPSFNPDVTDSNLRGKSAGSGTIKPPVTDWKARLVEAETHLIYEFNEWLRSQQLHEIRVKIADICRKYSSQKTVNLYLICGSTELARLPWESWEIGVELATTAQLNITRIPNNFTSHPTPTVKRSRPRILAIIGQDGRLNFEQDFLTLQNQLKPLATVERVGWKPGKSISDLETEIKQAITDEKGWDVLFFAGHSNETNLTGGELGIAPGEFLHIKHISHQLEIAKNNGLKFALFNSCNGLKIAETLINLGLSQVAVMREPIHNKVAQEFLLEFLQNLAQYKDVQESLSTTCKLLKLDKSFTYPSAYLIPSLFCYPDTQWFKLKPSGWKHFWKQLFRPKCHEIIAMASLSVLSLFPFVQYNLLEQRVMMQAIYRDRTGQVPDNSPAIFLVKIDNSSLEEGELIDPQPISRKYLARLIDQAAKLDVNVLGIDYLLNISWPEEDQALEKSLTAIKSEQKIQSIFITSRDSNNQRRWTLPKFADKKWQGDSRVWENGRYMTLLPLEHEERPFPLSYLLALSHKTREYQTDSLEEMSPNLLIDNWFSPWMRPLLFTRYFYQYYQYWLHPIVDFSIPQSRVYESISAQEFLDTQPEQLQKRYPQSVIMIVPGGYANAGINRPGEDNFPVPPAFCYWQNKSQPNHRCRILLGGEIHAYLFHHFLEKKSVIPVPDLWFLWLFALAAKSLKVAADQYELDPKKVVFFISGGTLVYGLVCLQVYVSASVLLPIVIPVSLVWIYFIPEVNPRKS